MCKYSSVCDRCKQEILVEVNQKNMQDAEVVVSSDCSMLSKAIPSPLTINVMYEIIANKTDSHIYNILADHHDTEGCTAYDSIKSALEKNLGRYYELA